MTTALEKTLQSLSKQPLTEGELAMGVQYLTGAVKCLLEMRMEILREGGILTKGQEEKHLLPAPNTPL